MAITVAHNPKTDEHVAWVDGAWQPIEHIAAGPKGELAYQIDGMWHVDPTPPAAMRERFAPKKAEKEEYGWVDKGRDALAAVLDIGPEALETTMKVADMISAGAVDIGAIKSLQEKRKITQDVLASEHMKKLNAEHSAMYKDDTKSAGELGAFYIDNPEWLMSKGVTSIGSMLLPVGAVGAATKLGTAAKLSDKALSKLAVSTSITTGAAQNAADTFAELKDLSLEDRYKGAATSAAVSILAGIVTKGGTEGALARRMVADLQAGKITAADVSKALKGGMFKSVLKETAQETLEEAGNILGEAVGRNQLEDVPGKLFDPDKPEDRKRLLTAALLGTISSAVAHPATKPRLTEQDKLRIDLSDKLATQQITPTEALEALKKAGIAVPERPEVHAEEKPELADIIDTLKKSGVAVPEPELTEAEKLQKVWGGPREKVSPEDITDAEIIEGATAPAPTAEAAPEAMPTVEEPIPTADTDIARWLTAPATPAEELAARYVTELNVPPAEALTRATSELEEEPEVAAMPEAPTATAAPAPELAVEGAPTPEEATPTVEATAPAPETATPTVDPIYTAAVEAVRGGIAPSPKALAASQRITETKAKALIRQMQDEGVVSAPDPAKGNRRTVLPVPEPAAAPAPAPEAAAAPAPSITPEEVAATAPAVAAAVDASAQAPVSPDVSPLAAINPPASPAAGLPEGQVAPAPATATAQPTQAPVSPAAPAAPTPTAGGAQPPMVPPPPTGAAPASGATGGGGGGQGRVPLATVAGTPQAQAAQTQRTQQEIDDDVDAALDKVKMSKQGYDAAQGVSILQALREPSKIWPAFQRLWKRFDYKQRETLVKAMTTDFLVYGASKSVPALKDVNVLLQSKAGAQQFYMQEGSDVVDALQRAMDKMTPAQRSLLEELPLAATLARVDPANTDPNAPKNAKLSGMYNRLGPDGQKAYVLLRDYYKTVNERTKQILMQNIANLGISAAAKQNLVSKIEAMYIEHGTIDPYFPLVRRGKFWLNIKSHPLQNDRKFFMFETLGERDAAAAYFAKQQYRNMNENAALERAKNAGILSVGNDLHSMRDSDITKNPSKVLTDLFDAIDSMSGDLDTKNASGFTPREELKDAMYQIYIDTRPDDSFRKQFAHREDYGLVGFSVDLVRDTADRVASTAPQLANLEYAPKLRNMISQAEDSVSETDEFYPYVGEMKRRVESEISPPTTDSGLVQAANVLNKTSVLFYLSSFSTAILQPANVLTVGYFNLAGEYGHSAVQAEMFKESPKFWKYLGVRKTNPDGSKSWVAPTIEQAGNLTPIERKAVEAMRMRDVTHATQAREVMKYKGKPREKRSLYAARGPGDALSVMWGKLTSAADVALLGAMHSTERLSREYMFRTAFALHYKKTGNFDASVDRAIEHVHNSLGNYASYARPMVMKGAIGKMVLQFKMYPLFMTNMLLHNVKGAISTLSTREEKRQAVTTLAGVLGSTLLHSGVKGLPLYTAVAWMATEALKHMGDDDDEYPNDIRKIDMKTYWENVFIPEKLGPVTIGGYKLSDLLMEGPLDNLTGFSVGQRLALNDMWLKAPPEQSSIQNTMLQYGAALAGPSASLALQWGAGLQAFSNGDYDKGFDSISPAFLKAIRQTARVSEKEGVVDANGNIVLEGEKISLGRMVGRSMGFRFVEEVRPKDQAAKERTLIQAMDSERSTLLRRFDNAIKNDDDDALMKLWDEEVPKFNAQYPQNKLTVSDVAEYRRGLIEQRSGVVPKRAQPLINQMRQE